jgi:cytochrome c oxidase subunit 2
MLAAVFLVLCYLLLWPMLFHRGGSRHRVPYWDKMSRPQLLVTLLVPSLIFFVIDGNLFVNSTADLHDVFFNYPDNEADVTRVEVQAQQWAWNFRYPGDDGVFNTGDDIVTLNELRMPNDKPLMLQMTSKDVIHSFSLPWIRRKQDVIPGAIRRIWFTPKPSETGDYEIVCAEMCGLNHYKMRGLLTLMSSEEYAAWHATAGRYAVAGYDPDDAEAHWGWDWEAFN